MNGLLEQLPSPPPGKTGWPWTIETDPASYNSAVQYPKISIVTPSYNQGQFIEETIRSILLQNYPNLEYIIMDGGSTDQTVEIIKKYEPWITYWVSEKDKGQSHAINKGFQMATGEIYNWINSDDFLTRDALKEIADEFLKPGFNAGIIAGGIKHFGINEKNFTHVSSKNMTTEELLPGMPCPQPSGFFLKKYYTICGGLNESYAYAMDYDLYIKIMLLSKIAFIDKVVAYFRLHDTSKTSTKKPLFLEEARIIFFKICVKYKLSEVVRHLKNCDEYDPLYEKDKMESFEASHPARIDEPVLAMNYLTCFAIRYFNIGEVARCKKIMHYLKRSFNKSDLNKIPDFKTIEFKSGFPGALIKTIKHLKSGGRRIRYMLTGK